MHFLATFLPEGKKLPYEIPMLYVCKCVCSVSLPFKDQNGRQIFMNLIWTLCYCKHIVILSNFLPSVTHGSRENLTYNITYPNIPSENIQP